jgi:hypothetical protein
MGSGAGRLYSALGDVRLPLHLAVDYVGSQRVRFSEGGDRASEWQFRGTHEVDILDIHRTQFCVQACGNCRCSFEGGQTVRGSIDRYKDNSCWRQGRRHH